MAEKPENPRKFKWVQEVAQDGSIKYRPNYEVFKFKPPPSEIIEARVKSSLSSENATSSSFAVSASYATNATSASYAFNATSASYAVSASVEIKKEVSSSYADFADTASLSYTANTASYVISSSIDGITNYVRNDQTSSMSVATASYVLADDIDQPFTNIIATNNITAGASISASSGLYGRDLFLGPTARFNHTTGGQFLFLNDINASSVNITSSNIQTTDIKTTSASGSFSGSFEGDGTNITGIISSSYATSSSFAPSLYKTNGTIGTSRTATITDSLTWSGGQEIRTTNSRIYREVTQASELPTTLVANTTYIIKGEITISSNITCTVEGVEITGIDRNLDHIIWSGTGALLTITDVNFGLNNVRFSSTQAGNSILVANNVAASGYNNGRLKVLTIFNCQFRGTYDVMDINGFDLVDINNTLFFYIKATNFGLRFRDVSILEISSCEIIRWFDESTIPSPSGWSTVSMVELQNNNLASFGAVNINGCIIHPQQTQNGINIGTSSTTGFGTISSNAFVTVGLTTGEIFLPIASGLADYSQTATYNYDVFANQGVLNSVSGVVMTLNGNTTNTALSSGTPAVINTGGGATLQAGVRYNITAAGRATYVGTKQVYVSLHSSLTYEKQGGGTDTYNFYYYKNGVLLPGSGTEVVGRSAGTQDEGVIALVYGTLMTQNDYIEIYVENVGSNDDMLIKDFQIVIRE